ncbi:DNA helicase PcrA [Anaerosalibacter bizertensis]|uniref:DNA helicase PcrA n=1 Tax=Anaerosalibacter bizertensis TaxID=932217 RepID=UPI001C0EDC9A|nr:DNA helicase PcrA [Anaerosalibacter bizertensis]MBU5292913.1 DNA helicase PcrA [Anaerosalibacter bizertensis]
MSFVEGLNDRQKEAVLHTEGPLLILAGAGSGKTRVLTHRIAYMIEEKEVFPNNILAITFTNKAANEMKERVGSLVGDKIEDIWIGTFHSICVRILRMNINKIGYDRSFTIYDTADQKTLIKECIKEQNVDKEMFKEKTILGTISSLKDKMKGPDTYIKANEGNYYNETVGKIYALYEKKLRKNNALDFDDLILKTIQLLRTNPDVLELYQRKFRYIFVDEYQDTNKAQYELIKLFSGRYKNLCVVGDDDQSIYRFRGADIRNILDFEKDFPDAKIIKLEQNYRSTKNILTVANSIIKNNNERKNKKLWTDNIDGSPVILSKTFDERDEANFVAETIRELVDSGKYKPSDFAILYRTNAQSRAFEEVFMRRNISYKIVGGLKFYDRKEIKDIIAYLRLIQNPVDDISFRRVINVPKRGIGAATIEKIENYASQTGESLYSAILDVEDIPGLSKRAVNNLTKFTDMINKFIAMKEVMDLKDFIEEVVNDTGYIDELEKEDTIEATTRIENLKEFISVAIDFEMMNEEGTLEDFLADISLLSDVDNMEEANESVTMLTVHSAKGLEFPVVFLVGMEEGLFPMGRALDSESELEEERRLCYVAVTRAEEVLYITYANLRTIYGNTTYSSPSRFLKEMPRAIIQDGNEERLNTQGFKTSNLSFGGIGKKDKLRGMNENKQNVSIGSKVRHKKWGEGTVVQVKEKSGDMEIVVAFKEQGIKKLLLSVAPIEII